MAENTAALPHDLIYRMYAYKCLGALGFARGWLYAKIRFLVRCVRKFPHYEHDYTQYWRLVPPHSTPPLPYYKQVEMREDDRLPSVAPGLPYCFLVFPLLIVCNVIHTWWTAHKLRFTTIDRFFAMVQSKTPVDFSSDFCEIRVFPLIEIHFWNRSIHQYPHTEFLGWGVPPANKWSLEFSHYWSSFLR